MKILNLNVNDFGGLNEHLFSYKYRKANGYTDWVKWGEETEKIQKEVIENLTRLIDENNPDVCIFQEFAINNSVPPLNFAKTMEERGYKALGICSINYKASITLFFIKISMMSKTRKITIDHSKTGLTARDYAIRYENGNECYIIYGTHVPYGGTKRVPFWNEIINFYKKNEKENLVLIGDFNTFDTTTLAYQKYQELLELGVTDLWIKQGGSHNDETELNHHSRLDYVLLSPAATNNCDALMKIIKDESLSDHVAFIFEIENKK